MREILSALLILLLAPTVLHAQSLGSLSGMVYDAVDDSAIPGAHVYIASTTIGDITDPNGFFRITDVQAGSYQLIITMIGYKPLQRPIEILPNAETDLNLKLEKDVYQVGEITVTESRPKQWRRDLNRFKRMFLGITSNRSGCDIDYPYHLNFNRQGDVFTADTNVPITVINKSLGYEVIYILNEFSASGGMFRFIGEPLFKELEPKNDKERRKWEKRRQQTYAGSFNHFLRSMAAGTFDEDGYELYQFIDLQWKMPHKKLIRYLRANGRRVRLQPEKIIKQHHLPHERSLQIEDFLYVFYNNKVMERDFYEWISMGYNPSKEPVRAIIRNIHTEVVFNEIGFLNNAFGVERYGYWNWDSGICNWLPFNYGLEPAG